jgi:signal transduction histidine kinase
VKETLFQELKRYVDFGPGDESVLKVLHPLVSPHFPRIADVFYRRILDHEGSRKALEGESRVGQLKITLVAWMSKLFQGPWDEEYYELRCRIGRMHVRIALPQHYMFGAMSVLRCELGALIENNSHRGADVVAARRALDKILDLELAIMLHTYREDFLAQQARTERLSTFGQLVGSIGHELRNPLGVIESSLFILKGRIGEDERAQKHLARIGEQLRIANDIISALLDMIRDRPLAKGPVQIAEVLGGILSSMPLPKGVAVTCDGVKSLPAVSGDAIQLRQVFTNLIQNAVHATGETGEVHLIGALLGDTISVAVEDRGPGVNPEIGRRLFEPLVSTKAKGIGLGLALVKRMVERHGGTVAYEAREGGGARFVVRLPKGDDDA